MSFWGGETRIPVSYTHLDVYKRQSQKSVENNLAISGKADEVFNSRSRIIEFLSFFQALPFGPIKDIRKI